MSPGCRENPGSRPFSRLGRVPRPVVSTLLLALAALAALLGGCGEEDAELLPGGTAREITANLDSVQTLADEGDCLGAESAALQIGEQVEALEGVDPRLKRALAAGAERLEEVVARCEEELEATEPVPSDAEAEEEAAEELQKAEDEEEKEEKEREKEEKEQEREDEGDDEDGGPPPPLPPQAESEGKGVEGDGDEPAGGEGTQGGGTPSGGLSPANPAGEGG
jgi:hypothetical protein